MFSSCQIGKRLSSFGTDFANAWVKAIRRTQRRYDHRLRQLVQSQDHVDLAREYGVPVSTARAWLQKLAVDVVKLDMLNEETIQRQNKVLQLRQRFACGDRQFLTPYPDMASPGEFSDRDHGTTALGRL
ncbi:hypothetical protein [uncultured Rubinisphaera sp.]|uniref:hypothetical protein n=1 Tax=uncultured Rubinisphaera sp. TaxID=1678686 RepID=UPI0030D725E5